MRSGGGSLLLPTREDKERWTFVRSTFPFPVTSVMFDHMTYQFPPGIWDSLFCEDVDVELPYTPQMFIVKLYLNFKDYQHGKTAWSVSLDDIKNKCHFTERRLK